MNIIETVQKNEITTEKKQKMHKKRSCNKKGGNEVGDVTLMGDGAPRRRRWRQGCNATGRWTGGRRPPMPAGPWGGGGRSACGKKIIAPWGDAWRVCEMTGGREGGAKDSSLSPVIMDQG